MEIYGSQIRENIIEINNNKDILNLLLKNFDDYIKLNQEQKNKALYKITDNIEIRLRVIFFIYGHLNNNIFDKNFQPILLSLWKSAILSPNSRDTEKNIFCSFLFKRDDIIENNEEIRNYLFYKIMLDEIKNPPHNIIYNEICLFNKLLYAINYYYVKVCHSYPHAARTGPVYGGRIVFSVYSIFTKKWPPLIMRCSAGWR